MLGIPIKSRYTYPGNSYVKLYLEDGRVVDEHRYVMTQELGRELEPEECVHHRNDTKNDNRPENLELQDKRDHARNHGLRQGKRWVELTCGCCGKDFTRERRQVVTKLRDKQAVFYCSRRCVGAATGRAKRV